MRVSGFEWGGSRGSRWGFGAWTVMFCSLAYMYRKFYITYIVLEDSVEQETREREIERRQRTQCCRWILDTDVHTRKLVVSMFFLRFEVICYLKNFDLKYENYICSLLC